MANSPSDVTKAAIMMSVAMLFFAAMPVIVRYLSDTIPAVQQVFFRGVLTALVMLPWMLRGGFRTMRTRRLGLMGVRSTCIAFGVLTWFYAIARLPLAEATALHFTLPLFGIVLAMLFLGERSMAHRWIAIGIGFSGVLVIIRPGAGTFDPIALLVLFSAFCYAVGTVVTKTLVRTEQPELVVFYMNFYALPLFIVPTVIYWVTPNLNEWLLLGALAGTTMAAHIGITRAMVLADAGFLLSFDFLRLPFAAVAGFVLFAEMPDLWILFGALIIFGAAYYITTRERAEEKHRDTMPEPPVG